VAAQQPELQIENERIPTATAAGLIFRSLAIGSLMPWIELSIKKSVCQRVISLFAFYDWEVSIAGEIAKPAGLTCG
jgi:hypothetical protein